jgi:hypothetical protein
MVKISYSLIMYNLIIDLFRCMSVKKYLWCPLLRPRAGKASTSTFSDGRPPIAPGRSIGPGLTLGESRVRKPDASVSGSGRGGDRGRARIHTRLRPWQVATARSLWGCHLSARPLTSKTRDRLRGSQGLKSNGQRWNEVQPE